MVNTKSCQDGMSIAKVRRFHDCDQQTCVCQGNSDRDYRPEIEGHIDSKEAWKVYTRNGAYHNIEIVSTLLSDKFVDTDTWASTHLILPTQHVF